MVCGISLSPFGRCLWKLGAVPGIGEPEMKPDDLELCIEALKALRQEMHKETDASVIGKLEEVILQLEECLRVSKQSAIVPAETRRITLGVLADALHVVTNLSELICLWLDKS